MKQGLIWSAILLLIGSCWGMSIPFTKLAVSTGHAPLGLIFWQLTIGVIIMSLIALIRGIRLPLTRKTVFFCGFVALAGTILPNSVSYVAAAKLPGGIMAIAISMVPIFAMPIALALGLEQLSPKRISGVVLGAVAILVLMLPSTDLPGANASLYVLLALIAPFCYAAEDNFVAIKGSAGLDPMQVILGASVIGLILVTPMVAATNSWVDLTQRWSIAEWSLIGTSVLHTFAYTSFIWLISRAGPVYASMVAYIVTGTGVLWSMLILDERYTGPVWIALALMLIAMTLVRPKETHETSAES